MVRRIRKTANPEERHKGESAPLWIISFADLVVLLMSFFVILSAGNPKDIAYDPDFVAIVAAVKKAFHYVPSPESHDPVDMHILRGFVTNMTSGNKKPSGSGRRGEAKTHVPGLEGLHDTVATVGPGKTTTIGGTVPFAKDSAELDKQTTATVQRIADLIRGHTNVFLIKGHTSRDEEYHLRNSQRDLAYDRGVAIVDKLVSFGIPRNVLRVQSCRDYEPIRRGTFIEADHAVNRRVEVIATEALVNEFQGERADVTPRKDDPFTGDTAPDQSKSTTPHPAKH